VRDSHPEREAGNEPPAIHRASNPQLAARVANAGLDISRAQAISTRLATGMLGRPCRWIHLREVLFQSPAVLFELPRDLLVSMGTGLAVFRKNWGFNLSFGNCGGPMAAAPPGVGRASIRVSGRAHGLACNAKLDLRQLWLCQPWTYYNSYPVIYSSVIAPPPERSLVYEQARNHMCRSAETTVPTAEADVRE